MKIKIKTKGGAERTISAGTFGINPDELTINFDDTTICFANENDLWAADRAFANALSTDCKECTMNQVVKVIKEIEQ